MRSYESVEVSLRHPWIALDQSTVSQSIRAGLDIFGVRMSLLGSNLSRETGPGSL